MRPYSRELQILATDDGSITADALEGVLDHQDYLCALCGLIPRITTIDHIVPLRHGGAHTISNIQIVCRTCNGRKSDVLPSHVSPKRTILQDRHFPHPLESVFALWRGWGPEYLD